MLFRSTYLDRDKDLADKFQEDPKQNIGSALIYFPTDPEHAEELFERAQKVDHEQWSRQDYKYFWTTNLNYYYVITRDRCYYAGCKSQHGRFWEAKAMLQMRQKKISGFCRERSSIGVACGMEWLIATSR